MLSRWIKDGKMGRMPPVVNGHCKVNVRQNTMIRVIDGLQEMDRRLVENDALHPDSAFVRVDPVEGGVVPSGPQPDGTVTGGTDVDAVWVAVTICDGCVAAV